MLDGDSDGYRGNDDSTKLFPSLQGGHYSACIGHLQQRSPQSHPQHSARLFNFYSLLFTPTQKLVCTCGEGVLSCPALYWEQRPWSGEAHTGTHLHTDTDRGLSHCPLALGISLWQKRSYCHFVHPWGHLLDKKAEPASETTCTSASKTQITGSHHPSIF